MATWYEMAYAEAEGAEEMKAALQAKSDVLDYSPRRIRTCSRGYEANRAGAGAHGASAAEQMLAEAEKSTGTPRAALSAAAQEAGQGGYDYWADIYEGVHTAMRGRR